MFEYFWSNIFNFNFFIQKCSNLKALSQGTTRRPHPLSFDPSLMKDTQCAEYNLFFLSIQPIPDLSCDFDQFWKKNWFCCYMYTKHCSLVFLVCHWYQPVPTWVHQSLKKIIRFWMLFGGGLCPPTKEKQILIFFLNVLTFLNKTLLIKKKNQKCSNLHERFRISWMERKLNFRFFRFIFFELW